MALKVTVDKPQFPKGQEFAIQGIGIIENGKALTLTADQERDYAAFHGKTVRDGLSGDEAFKVEGTAEWKDGVESVHPSDVSTVNENATPVDSEGKEVSK